MTTEDTTRPRKDAKGPKAGTLGAAGAGTTLASLSQVVGTHSVWSTILLLSAPSVSALSAVYGPYLREVFSNYLKAEFERILKQRAEKKARERPIKEAKKHLEGRLKNPALSPERKAALLEALEALDDITLAATLEAAGLTIAAVTVEPTEQDGDASRRSPRRG